MTNLNPDMATADMWQQCWIWKYFNSYKKNIGTSKINASTAEDVFVRVEIPMAAETKPFTNFSSIYFIENMLLSFEGKLSHWKSSLLCREREPVSGTYIKLS